jgi:hypothetical protein
VSILSRHTGLSEAAVTLAIDRNAYYSAQEAQSFGLVDGVMVKAPLPPAKASNAEVATTPPAAPLGSGVQVYKGASPAEAIFVATLETESAKK